MKENNFDKKVSRWAKLNDEVMYEVRRDKKGCVPTAMFLLSLILFHHQ